IEAESEAQELRAALTTEQEAAQLILRLMKLADAPHDPTYSNRHDVALAAYLWALHAQMPHLARHAALIVRSCPGCWWAAQLADALLAPAETAQPVEAGSARAVG